MGEIMKDTPRWVFKAIEDEKLKCHKCKTLFKGKSLVAVGIRKSFKGNGKEALFIELQCLKCEDMTLFELQPMGLFDMSLSVLEEQENKLKEEMSKRGRDIESIEELSKEELEEAYNKGRTAQKDEKRRRKSKITLSEIKEVSKFLNKCKSGEEFLIALGMSPEEIEKYSYKKKNNE
jgi:hypothetical protein